MAWIVEIDPSARKTLKKIDPQNANRILKFLFERVAYLSDPRSIGEALQGPKFKTLWKYRVGDYRVICNLENETCTVIVIKIGDRKEIYRL